MNTNKNRLRSLNSRLARRRRPQLVSLEERVLLSGVNVTQYHNDSYLSGANLNETTLTPSNVNPTNFGLLYSHPVDGYVYAEPLILSGVTINGVVHDVAIVATENDTVYAFDADSNQGIDASPLWVHGFTDPASGITAIPQPDVISHDIYPVIDPSTNTLYVVTNTEEIINGDTSHPNYLQTLHALNVATGQEVVPGGYVIGNTVNNPDGSHVNNTVIQVAGTGDDSVNGIVTFNALRQNQRAALQIDGNSILVAWASHGDITPYHGWVVAFDKTTLQPTAWYNTAPNGTESGIWQSGDPPAVDPATGAIYFATGNGTFDQYGNSPNNDYGESVVRLNPIPVATPQGNEFAVQDYFTPYEFQTLNNNDADLGSGGTMLLPDSVGSAQHPHLMVETGKSGKIYLIDRDDMGKVPNPGTGPDANVQTVTAGQAGVWGSPTYYQVNSTTGIIYYHGTGDVLKGYYVTDGHIEDGSQAGDLPILRGSSVAGYPGVQPVISANGTVDPSNPTDAIVWELQVDKYGTSGASVLRAYNALDPTNELYDSSLEGLRDQLAGAVKFTVPTVANGRVYVGSEYSFSVFGLFPASTAAPLTPTGLTATTTLGKSSVIQLSWTNPIPAPGAAATGIEILRSTDGVNFNLLVTLPAETTAYTDPGPFSLGQPYSYELVAVNQTGSSAPSAPAQVNITITPPVLTLTNVTSTAISLSWSAVANDHYVIERSSDGVNFSAVATVPASQLTDTDTGLTPGMYSYYIEAYNANPVASSISNVRGVTVGSTVDEGIGFVNTTGLTANGSAQFAEATARLTNANDQIGSVFTNNRFTIGSFNTSFTVRLHEGTQPNYADGITFVIQAVAPSSLGQGFGGMGYQGIGKSIAIKLDPYQNPGDPSDSSTGLYENGAGPFGGVDTTGNGGPLINSQATKLITLTYDGTTLTETITNTLDPSQVFTTSYPIDLSAVIGSDTAYVGFTGSTGDNQYWELQDITGWTFTSTEPLPGAPNNLQGSNPTPSEIDLTWSANSYNETGFAVERSTDGVNFTQIGTTTSTSYQDTGLVTGSYEYRVFAFNASGNSPDSNTLNFATGTLIDYSNGFTVHSGLSGNGNIDWNAPALQLTNGYGGEASSSFDTSTVPILNFTTTFTFQMLPGVSAPPIADGITFTIQDSPAGTAALGQPGGGLGYSTIANSVAIKFDSYKPGGDHSSTGLYVNGDYPTNGVSGPGDVYVPLDGTGIDFNGAANALVPHTFQATLSYDGSTLTETITDETTGATFSTAYSINLPAYLGSTRAYVGFTGGTGGATSIQDIDTWTGDFLTNPPPLPTPWQDQDVGGPAIAGSAVDSNGTWTINGSGADIWGTADQFNFAYQAHTGDLVAIAKVTSQDDSGPWAKAGLMVRDGFDTAASFALIAATPGNGIVFQYRDGDGNQAQWNGQIGGAAPEWVMMVRSGSTFSGFASTDGVNWTFVGNASITMNDPVHVGLAVGAVNGAVLGNATFQDVSVESLLLPPSFSDADVGAPGLSGSGIFNPINGTWTVNGGGSDIWNGADQFNYASEAFNGDGTLVARVNGLNYTDPWAKAGVMFRNSLDAGSVFADMVVTPGNGVAFQWRDQFGNLGNEQIGGIVAPEWVELVRQGNVFSGYYSADGVNWISAGASVTLTINTNALAGLAVTAHNDGALNSAAFTNFSATPSGWSDQDIGNPGLPGGSTFDGLTWTVLGGGSDIGNGGDQFNFVSRSFTGDAALTTVVNSQTVTDPSAKAGVMFRESTDPSAVFADVESLPGHAVSFQWRDSSGNLGDDQISGITAPIHVLLSRAGDVFTGYYSTDGKTWVEIGSQTLTMNPTSLVGLAVTAHNNASLNEATFTDVSIIQLATVTDLSIVGPAVRNQPVSTLDVTFSEPINLSTLLGSLTLTINGNPVAIPPGTLTASLVPNTTATYTIDGLSGLTIPEGLYTLTVNASSLQDQNGLPGAGALTTSWLMDTTVSTSDVMNTLGSSQTSDTFPVSVSFNDPSGFGGAPASGVSSLDLYVSVNNGPFLFNQTLNFAPTVSGTETFTFEGQDRNLYAFHAVAHDAAGNVETKAANAIEASTGVLDLNPPVTHVLTSNPSYSWSPFPSSIFSGLVVSTYSNGVFTINWAGADPDQKSGTPLGSIALVNIYVEIDGGAPMLIGQPVAGSPDGNGVDNGSLTYDALADNTSHNYSFFSVGVDDEQKQQALPSSPDATFPNIINSSAPLGVQQLVVEKNIAARSFIQYLDVDFTQSLATSPRFSALRSLANGLAGGNPDSFVELLWYGEGLTSSSVPEGSVNLFDSGTTASVALSGNDLSIDFGPNGITSLLTETNGSGPGKPSTNFGDGWYALGIDPTGDPSNNQVFWLPFFRLLGDTNGDGIVSGPYSTAGTDASNVFNAKGQSGRLLDADVDGSGAVNTKDLTLTVAAKGHAVGSMSPSNFPRFQLFAGVALPVNPVAVTQAEVQALLPLAIDDWRSAGLDPADVRLLQNVQIQVGNLGTGILGLEAAGVILINQTAAGDDWYLDTSTSSTPVFGLEGPGGETLAGLGSPAEGRVDLLTVLEHELGHIIGLPDNTQAGDLMDVTLRAGVRRAPTALDVATALQSSSIALPNPSAGSVSNPTLSPIPTGPSTLIRSREKGQSESSSRWQAAVEPPVFARASLPSSTVGASSTTDGIAALVVGEMQGRLTALLEGSDSRAAVDAALASIVSGAVVAGEAGDSTIPDSLPAQPWGQLPALSIPERRNGGFRPSPSYLFTGSSAFNNRRPAQSSPAGPESSDSAEK